MNWIQNLVVKLLRIIPASEKEVNIRQAYTFQQNVLKNRIWYHGEPAELEQFFKKTSRWDCDKTKFWAATPDSKIRKIHSGIVSMVVDRYKDITTANYEGVSFGEEASNQPLLDMWEKIAADNNFIEILGDAITGALSVGDGAFKISTDKVSEYPIIEFYEADNVSYTYRYGHLQEIKFYTDYPQNKEHFFRLEETYGKGYIRYKLFDDRGRERKLSDLEETRELTDITFDGDFIMGEPFRVLGSFKWKHRGKALFDTKSDVLDSLDEVISQWLDAVRLGRIKRYIPEDLIPTDPLTGKKLPANPFDNDFMAIPNSMQEGETSKIDISQPQIAYEAYVNSYIQFMDMVLQGIISPATLGIDLKKTDNAEAQREKEKITLHILGKIFDSLTKVLPNLILSVMKTYNLTWGKRFEDCKITVKFGEYASPDFDSTVDIVSKARNAGIMSVEKAVDQLYGDGMSEKEKQEEVERIKLEQGVLEESEPALNLDGLEVEDEGADRGESVSDGKKGIQEIAGDGKRTG